MENNKIKQLEDQLTHISIRLVSLEQKVQMQEKRITENEKQIRIIFNSGSVQI